MYIKNMIAELNMTNEDDEEEIYKKEINNINHKISKLDKIS